MELRWPQVIYIAREASRLALEAERVAEESLWQHEARIRGAEPDDADLRDARTSGQEPVDA